MKRFYSKRLIHHPYRRWVFRSTGNRNTSLKQSLFTNPIKNENASLWNNFAVVFLILGMLSLHTEVYPQTSCDLTGFETFSQGTWGGSSNSPSGKLRDNYFTTVFPTGLKIGSTYTLTLTSSQAVDDFLPAGGSPDEFTKNYIDPKSTSAGSFAGQVVALAMTIGYDNAGLIGGGNPLKLKTSL